MTLTEFLEHINQPSFPSSSASVVCITGAEYPLLFFSQVYAQLKKQGHMNEQLDVTAVDEADAKAMLATSFLGMNKIYWLHTVDELEAKSKNRWLTYLKAYAGPHKIIFFLSDASLAKGTVWTQVAIPHPLDKPLCKKIVTTFGHAFTDRMRYFVDELMAKRPVISLDMFCLCVAYAVVAGKGVDRFLHEWLDELMPREESLFTLSQHFFAKDMRAFFALWMSLKERYAPQFWIAFWSEQVWRAAFFVQLQQNKEHGEAKKTAFKLPFSFMQRHWRMYTVAALQAAHDALYLVDCQMKHGVQPYILELWFVEFFTHEPANIITSMHKY